MPALKLIRTPNGRHNSRRINGANAGDGLQQLDTMVSPRNLCNSLAHLSDMHIQRQKLPTQRPDNAQRNIWQVWINMEASKNRTFCGMI